MSGSIKKDIAAGKVTPQPYSQSYAKKKNITKKKLNTNTKDTFEPKPKRQVVDNISKYHAMRRAGLYGNGRKRIAKTLEIYIRQYLLSDASVRHFRKWADARPGEALPWAWKAVYGDGTGVHAVGKGQINVLVQILTGKRVTPSISAPDPLQVDITSSSLAQALSISNDINELDQEKS